MKLMHTTEGNTARDLPMTEGQVGYDVIVVDPNEQPRTKLVMLLAGVGARAFSSFDEYTSEVAGGRPTVVVLGPSLADEDGVAPVAALTDERRALGVVLAAERLTTEALQHALRSGVRDAVAIEDGAAELLFAIDRVGGLMVAVSERPAQVDAPAGAGRVIVCFSTKGGVGKSVLSTNLAASLAKRSDRPVAIVDSDLQFGDVAVLLGVAPERTVMDAAAAVHHGDPELMRALVMRHDPTGLLVLPAPVEPSTADQIRPEDMLAIVDSLKQFCGTVVVDMPPHFDDNVLALLDVADEVILVASMDIPSIKNLKVGMQTLDLLAVAGPKLRLVLNRANARVKLDVKEVEKALGIEASFHVPSDIAVPQAVNRGVPVVVDNPRSPAARAFEDITTEFLAVEAVSVDGNRAGGDRAAGSGKRRRFGR
jgi:pilus assembly protein CpaE